VISIHAALVFTVQFWALHFLTNVLQISASRTTLGHSRWAQIKIPVFSLPISFGS